MSILFTLAIIGTAWAIVAGWSALIKRILKEK